MGTALAVLFIALSYYISNLSLSFTALAALGVLLPLTRKYYSESLLCCLAAGIIGFFIANIRIIPFLTVSSFYVVFSVLWYNKKLSRIIGYVIKILYSIFVFYILYKLTSLIVVDFSKLKFLAKMDRTLLYVLLNLVFSFCFVIYDILLLELYKYLSKTVTKILKS